MGYPEEDSDNKKVEKEKIFSDGFTSKHSRSSNLTKDTNYCEVISSKVFIHDETVNSEDFNITDQPSEIDNTLKKDSEVSLDVLKLNIVNRDSSKNNGTADLCNSSLGDLPTIQTKEVISSSANANLYTSSQNLESINGLKAKKELLCAVGSGSVESSNTKQNLKAPSAEECLKISSLEECLKISSPEESLKISSPEESLKISSPEESFKISSPEESLKISSPEESLKISGSEECLKISCSLVSNNFTSPVESENVSCTKLPTESFSNCSVELNNELDKSQISKNKLGISDKSVISSALEDIISFKNTETPFHVENKELKSYCETIKNASIRSIGPEKEANSSIQPIGSEKELNFPESKYSQRPIDKTLPTNLPLGNSNYGQKLKRDKGKSVLATKPDYKKCLQKFPKKKQFSSKEIALMRGFPGRCKSISLFNGKFLTRGNVLANQIERFNLGLPKEKLKFVRINNIESGLKQKKGRGRAKKTVKRLREQNKDKKYARLMPKLSEVSSSKKFLKNKSQLSLTRKFKNKKQKFVAEKKESFNLESSNSNDQIFGGENSFIMAGTDSSTSNYMNIKDSEKLYSKLIEEASFTDFNSASDISSEHSDSEFTDCFSHESEVPDEVAKLAKPLSLRRRSLKSSAKMNLEVQDQCCGHWFPTKKSFIKHLIETDADPVHISKLIDNEMVKCYLCSCWTSINGEKKHLREKHGIKNVNKQDFLTTKVSVKPICTKAVGMRPMSRNSEPDKEIGPQNISRPCPMSKKKSVDTCAAKEIICNLTEDPKASDSVIKIASVSDLPNHLKPIIQLSPKENINLGISTQPSIVISSKSASLPSSILTSKYINGHVNDKRNMDKPMGSLENLKATTHINLDESRIRRMSRGSIKIYSPIDETTLQNKVQKFTLYSKNENFQNISKTRRLSDENNDLKGRRRSRYSMDSSPERMIKNMPISRIKCKKSQFKRNRIMRRNGRRIRRCGFHSSETSDAESDQSSYDSSVNHENDFLDYVDENDNVESIPTVELDLFTIDSYSEEPSVFLTDPSNPNFKVYASMDAIFVGDSALGDVTNQVGYITDGNNVVYVNPSHFLFPKIDDEENSSLKYGANKMKRSMPVQITRKSVKSIIDELQTVDSKINGKILAKQKDILALATESIKGYDKENVTVVDNMSSVNGRSKTVPSTPNDDSLLISNSILTKDPIDSNTRVPSNIYPIKSISTTSVATNSSTITHPLNSSPKIKISTNTTSEHSFRGDEKAVARPIKSTIIVKSNLNKRKLLLKSSDVKERLLATKDDIIIIKTSTSKQTAAEEIDHLNGTNRVPNTNKDYPKNNERTLNQSPSCVSISSKEINKINVNKSTIKQSHKINHVISLEEAASTTLVDDKKDYNINKFHENKQRPIRPISHDEVVNADYSMKTSKVSPVICDQLNKEVLSVNSFAPDRINGARKLNLIPSLSSDCQDKETDIASCLTSFDKIPTEELSGYRKDDVISLDDAIASLAPIDKDDIEECFTTANMQNAIDTVDIADLDSIAISSLNDINFTIVDPGANKLKRTVTSPCKSFNDSSDKAQPIVSKDKKIFEESNCFNNFTPCMSLPEINVTCESQVVVTSAELTPFETLEGGICLEDVLDNNTADFDLLSLKGFSASLKNDVAQTSPTKNVELSHFPQPSNSVPEIDLFASSSKVSFSPEKNGKNISSIVESSFSNSSSDELDASLEPVSFTPSKYYNDLDIADIVKGKSLWNTPLLLSPIRSNLAPSIVNTPSRSISKIKTFDQLHNVPLSSIPDLLSPSRDLADNFLKDRPVELSPNTVSSILSPKTYNSNYLDSPIFDDKSKKFAANIQTKLNMTPVKRTKANRSGKKSARKNIMHTPILAKDLHLTHELNSGINEDLPKLLFTPIKTVEEKESKANLVESFLSSDLPNNSPPNSYERVQPIVSPSKSPQNKYISLPSDLPIIESSPKKSNNPTLSTKRPISKRNSIKNTSFRKLLKVAPIFEGFDSSPNSISPEVANASTSLRMKISLKGMHHAKSEASFNNAPDTPLFTDDDDNVQHEDASSSSSSSSSGSSSSSSSDSSSSSSDDSSESDEENAGESKKIVLTQFDPVSGMRKQTPTKPATCSPNLDERKTIVVSQFDLLSGIRKKSPLKPSFSSQSTLSTTLIESVKTNLINNTDLTSLKITVREAKKGSSLKKDGSHSPKASKLEQVPPKNLQHVIPRSKVPESKDCTKIKRNQRRSELLGIEDPCVVSDHNLIEDRLCHPHSSKKDALSMISDNQKEGSDTEVVNEIKQLSSTSESNLPKDKFFDLSPKSPNSNDSFKTQNGKFENRDIRFYFSKFDESPVEQTKFQCNSVEPSKLNRFKSPNSLPATNSKRGIKRKQATDSMDIRTFLSPPQSENLSAPVVKNTLIGDKKACYGNQRNLTAIEAQKKYEDIVQRSLSCSDDLTPLDYNFEGFKTTFLVSNLRAKLLEEYVDVLKMTWWFHEDRYPIPVDQLCDWDDGQLNSILFENG